jgi:regulator of sirC expression with transglutaminase-like and TPR domain
MFSRLVALFFSVIVVALALAPADGARAVDPASEAESVPMSPLLPNLKELVDQVQKSVVVVSFAGRNGGEQGLGSGFIIREDGLIATNLHVLGEARPISVRTQDGKKYDVKTVFAYERSVDLAIVQIEAAGLPALELGDSDTLSQGQPVVAFGNPQGLEHSVVAGIVSGLRKDVDNIPMIQLAMPIERGNSGGPLVDLDGKVHGLITLKSLVTDNLGYAVAVNSLKPLLEKPNPVSMSKWLTIGVLNPKRWHVTQGDARWTQHAGHIHASGTGSAIGGRALCLSTAEVPDAPFEVAVTVRMEEPDGAAGLVFHSDGGDRHYGFYPSSGKLRFSRFDGATVYDWHVIRDERSPHYREGDWNRLKVRVDDGRLQCFCNDALVFEIQDDEYTQGRVGLAKFRHTTAEFKEFAVAKELGSGRPSPETTAKVTDLVKDIPAPRPPTADLVAGLLDLGNGGRDVLEERARLLEQQAERLRQLSRAVHEQRVRTELTAVLSKPEDEIDLLHASLLIAALDNDELAVDEYLRTVADLAAEFKQSLPPDVSEADRLAAFHKFLFEDQGFHGSRTNYYSASNSYLNEVIDDREGLPITLSVLYVELARRVGLKAVGIGLPGHFVAQYVPTDGEPQLIDVFDRGRVMPHEEAVAQATGRGLEWDEEYLRPQSPREIITRMLHNLIGVANSVQDPEAALRYVETVLALNPDSAQDRLFKALLCYNTHRAAEGLAEVEWIEKHPEGFDLEKVEELRTALQELSP